MESVQRPSPDNTGMEVIIIPTSAVETLIDHLLDRALDPDTVAVALDPGFRTNIM